MSNSLIYLNQVLGNCCHIWPPILFLYRQRAMNGFHIVKGLMKRKENIYHRDCMWPQHWKYLHSGQTTKKKKFADPLCKALISIQFGINILFFNCIIPFTFLSYCLYIIFILNTFVMNRRSFMFASEIVRIFYKSLV